MPYVVRLLSVLSICCSIFFFPFGANAFELKPISYELTPPQKNVTVLTVITSDHPQGRKFTLSEIESLGVQELKIKLEWEGESGLYQGVYLKDLLAQTGLENAPFLKTKALDDYAVKIPQNMWTEGKAILVTRRDGKELSIRNKGPLRLMFPTQEDSVLKSATAPDYWIWNLKSIQGTE